MSEVVVMATADDGTPVETAAPVPPHDLAPLARGLQQLAAKLAEVRKLARDAATIRLATGYAFTCPEIAAVGEVLRDIRREFHNRITSLPAHRRLCESVGIHPPQPEE